jgi:hypothetical protein
VAPIEQDFFKKKLYARHGPNKKLGEIGGKTRVLAGERAAQRISSRNDGQSYRSAHEWEWRVLRGHDPRSGIRRDDIFWDLKI